MSDPVPAGAQPPDRWYVLAVLTAIYALSIADRFSISTVIEPIRAELHLTDTKFGLITGVGLGLVYVSLGIPVAAYADRLNRRNILVAALALWSAMTACCGLASRAWQLSLARLGVGLGESGGTPPSTSMLADNFAPRHRPLAYTVYALGACLGAWLGSSVTGDIAERYGWRVTFPALGIPGIVLAGLVWLSVREPRRGSLDHGEATPAALARPAVRSVFACRSAFHLIVGGSVATLWSWGLMWWTPGFLQRSHHLSVAAAGELLGRLHLVAGTAGTLLAAWLMSRRAAADPRYVARLVALVALLTTIPSFLLYWVDSLRVCIGLLWLFVPGVYFYIGPILGVLQNVVPPQRRAMACALLLFLANFGNLVIAPTAVGWLSDWFRASWGAGAESLRWALLVLAPTGLWAAWHLWTSALTIREDEARVAGPRVTADATLPLGGAR